jgi:alkanesulfonate monooxygenase SsuD/methylene tetrahydromethanopterin reductase-like flavin-dependent oxidoreductase (luciferase family)
MPVSVGAVWPEALAADESLPDIAGLARVAEQAGLDGVWAGDRLIKDEMNVLDAGLVLAAAAAATERIAIGFSIYVPSLRPMAWAAREVASLQVLSAGRLQLGVALGGGPEREYQAVGLTGAHRARRTDDFLRLLPGLLGGEPVSLPDVPAGPVVRFRPAVPVPPVWVGGTAGAALRRAVSFGDGWLPGFLTAEEFAASARRLHELADESGRPRLRLGIATHATIAARPGDDLADVSAGVVHAAYGIPADWARQRVLAGTPAQVADQLAPYVQAGADMVHIVCDPVPSPESWELLAEVRQLLNPP